MSRRVRKEKKKRIENDDSYLEILTAHGQNTSKYTKICIN